MTTPNLPLSPAEDAERRASNPGVEEDVARGEHRALGWCAMAAVLVVAWIAMPVGVGILLGTLIAFSLQPIYQRLEPRLRASGAALVTVIGSTIALAGAFGGLGWLFVTKGASLARALLDAIGSNGGVHRLIEIVGGVTARFGVGPDQLEARLRGLAEEVAARAAAVAEAIASATASSLLALFFAMLTMHFILRNWERVALRAQQTFPLRPDYTRALFEEFRRVGRTTLLGTVLTGLAQGVLATIGYWICGVPEPVFFGAATAVASLIPAVGTMLVWVPAGIILIVTGHTLGGIGELVWGAAVIVGVSDYVIRPRLVGGEGDVPSLVTFAALFGGVEVFGLKGLILGPVAMSLAIAVLDLYAREAAQRRAAWAAKNRRADGGA